MFNCSSRGCSKDLGRSIKLHTLVEEARSSVNIETGRGIAIYGMVAKSTREISVQLGCRVHNIVNRNGLVVVEYSLC
jgi:hypothetical protein